MNGNTFDNGSVKYGHSRKVFRSIKAVYPGGGTISNVADFVSAGIIPAGTPVVFSSSNKTIKAIAPASVTAESGVNGYLQEDIVVKDENTVATGTVVYAGEIYEYMYTSAAATVLKALTTVPQIVWVQ